MKAEVTINELRVGNLLNEVGIDYIEDNPIADRSDLTLVEVDLKVLENILKFDNTTNYPLYEPIPLSEERLLKFGFEVKPISKWNGNDADYRPENVSTEQRDFVLDSFILRYEIFTFNNVSEITTYCGINSSWYPKVYFDSVPLYRLKYIHQLQNLYFALTGEELTIKSK